MRVHDVAETVQALRVIGGDRGRAVNAPMADALLALGGNVGDVRDDAGSGRRTDVRRQ